MIKICLRARKVTRPFEKRAHVNQPWQQSVVFVQRCLKRKKNYSFLFCFVSSGAETPFYVAMLPINAGKPQGEFLKDKVILEWETMSFRSHAVAADKDSPQEGR